MCQECDKLKEQVEKLDGKLKQVVRSTSKVVTSHKDSILRLEGTVNALIEVSNKNMESIIKIVADLQDEVSHIHSKVCDPYGGVQLPSINRLLH